MLAATLATDRLVSTPLVWRNEGVTLRPLASLRRLTSLSEMIP